MDTENQWRGKTQVRQYHPQAVKQPEPRSPECTDFSVCLALEAQLPIYWVPVLGSLYKLILPKTQEPTIWVPGLLGLNMLYKFGEHWQSSASQHPPDDLHNNPEPNYAGTLAFTIELTQTHVIV